EQKILVTGPNANLLSVLNGGWSYTWQGNEENFYPKNKMTILQAIEKKAGKENVVHVQGTAHNKEIDVKKAVDTAKESDVIIACIGEPVYCETPGNIDDLSLPDAQLNLVKQLQKTGKPVVLVLVEGRPRIITPVVENSAAILMAYLPGNEGGTAIADVLFGDCNPSGKLPITYPRNVNDLVCYDYKPNEIDDANKHNPLYDFGHGLSYTIFEYVDLKISENQIKTGDQIKIEVTIKNSGEMAGKETVELYLSDLVRSVTPPVRQLKRFKKVHLKPGESKTVEFTLSEEDLMFYGREGKFITEPGEFKVMIGNLSQNFILVN
ncbi:MAG: glycoside hydrolase family 3 C-terminal domain-containing protein, partial [Calditrichia bacterium]|nr:glycoside hydrolase family 3 C-terminal domain-containing protein [Calditrichia bacterium]